MGIVWTKFGARQSLHKTAILGRMNLKFGVACGGVDANAHCRCAPEIDLFEVYQPK